MVIFTHRAKVEKDSHIWNAETEHVDKQLKSRMQDLVCCPSTFYGPTYSARIEKAYEEARERREREGF